MTDEIKILLTKYLSGKISPEENNTVESWINQSEENEKLFHDIRSVWLLSGIESKDSSTSYKKVWSRIEHQIIENEKEQGNTKQIKFKPVYNLKKLLANAAMFTLAIGLGGLLMFLINSKGLLIAPLVANYQSANDTVEVIAQKGSKSEVILPDGSKVWLNSNSKIKYFPGFNNGKREVFLIGEAFFDVTHTDDDKLFYVHTSDIHVKVLGTTFNVKSYPEEGTIETTLEKGKVEIEKTVKDKIIKLLSLEPNQQATFIKKEGKIFVDKIKEEIARNNDDVPIQQIKRKEQIILTEEVDTDRYTSWKDGRLQFVSETFENMVVKFERWYDVKLVIENEDLNNIVFTASFEKVHIEQALNALKITHDFDYDYDLEGNTITIK